MDLSFVSVQQEAYAYVRERILNGSFLAGMHIRPGNVAEDLSISRMPVREALRQLEAEGLIVMRPNRGAVVMSLAADEVNELIELRAVLEGIALRYAMPKLKGEALADLEALVERMDRARGDPKLWIERHAEFHRFIFTLSERHHVAALISRIQNQLQPSTFAFVTSLGEEMEGHEHQMLMDAIRAGDVAAAEQMIVDHVREFSVTLTRFLSEKSAKEMVRVPRRAACPSSLLPMTRSGGSPPETRICAHHDGRPR